MTRDIMFFRSFKKELIVYTLGLAFGTIVLTTAIGIFSTQTAGDDAADAASFVLSAQAEKLLIQIVTAAAQQQDLTFERIRNDTENLAFYTGNLYKNPSVFSIKGYWDFDTRVIRKNSRYINSPSDISTFHIPSFVALDEAERENIELTAALDFAVPSMLESNENVAAIYTIDTRGVTRYFPNIILGELGPPDYDPRQDIYYLPATPENNSERRVIWSPLYDDVAGRGLMITATAPVYAQDEFAGIAATDVLLERIIDTITAYSPIEGSYAFLIDKEGVTIAFPDKAYEHILERPRIPGEGRINLLDHTLSQELLASLEAMSNGETGFTVLPNGGESDLFLAYAPLEQTGFSMGIVAEEEVVLKAVATLHQEISNSIRDTIMNLILPVSLFIISAAILIGIFISNQVVKPIQKLTEGAREMGKGNLDYRIKIRSRNEIGELAASFNQAYAELQRLDEAKSEFITIASHQLRTPLSGLKGYISMAQEGSYGKLPSQMRQKLDNMSQATERLISLADSFLNVSRMRSEKIDLNKQETNIAELLETIIAEMKPRAEERGLQITWKAPAKTLPNIFIDQEKMRTVLMGILDNAIRYTKKGGITINIKEQRENRKNKSILISVADTGKGLTTEETKDVFTSFKRGKTAQALWTEGVGLSLYVAKQFVEAHGGKIYAESPGTEQGSTFFVELPIK